VGFSLAVDIGIELLMEFGLSLGDDIDMLILLALVDNTRISSEGFMFEAIGKLIKLLLLLFDVDFRIVVEEDTGKERGLQPDCLHPFEVIGRAEG
jgi:hypothetical protein